jgi:hypothetical protein
VVLLYLAFDRRLRAADWYETVVRLDCDWHIVDKLSSRVVKFRFPASDQGTGFRDALLQDLVIAGALLRTSVREVHVRPCGQAIDRVQFPRRVAVVPDFAAVIQIGIVTSASSSAREFDLILEWAANLSGCVRFQNVRVLVDELGADPNAGITGGPSVVAVCPDRRDQNAGHES